MYPFVGGSASQHSYNLKDPTLYQITWNGGITHSSTGVLGNGSTGYGETNFNPDTAGADIDSFSLGYYSRTNNVATQCDVGGQRAGGSTYCTVMVLSNTFYLSINESAIPSAVLASTDKLIIGTRTGTNVVKSYRNAVEIASETGVSSILYDKTLKIMCYDSPSSGLIRFSQREQAMQLCMAGLDATEVTNLNTAIETYQTALSRNV